jgi:MinD-like ATPase involved in chromosome partitioning or flagellar assembly
VTKDHALAEACFYGKPAVLYNINSPGARAYLDLAGEITGKSVPLEVKRVPQQVEALAASPA